MDGWRASSGSRKMASARVPPGLTRVTDMDGGRDGWRKIIRADGRYVSISTSKSRLKIEIKQAETKAPRCSDLADLLLFPFQSDKYNRLIKTGEEKMDSH